MPDGKSNPSDNPETSLHNRIEKRVWIKSSAEVVYRALTHSKDLAKWFCDRAECTPSEGGELVALRTQGKVPAVAFWESDKGGHKGRAVFTSVVPNASLELLWVNDGCDTPPGSAKHTLCYTIKQKSGMTEVVMVDKDETTLDEETYEFLGQGWNSVLLELKDHCERKERSLRLRSVPEGARKLSPE